LMRLIFEKLGLFFAPRSPVHFGAKRQFSHQVAVCMPAHNEELVLKINSFQFKGRKKQVNNKTTTAKRLLSTKKNKAKKSKQ